MHYFPTGSKSGLFRSRADGCSTLNPLKQVAALPFVETETGVLVLLISTRGLGRWTIPRGWPKSGLSDADLAAREAFEESGIVGSVGARPIGAFAYSKRLHLLSWAQCRVEVYPLRAICQHLSWPEKGSRRTIWIEAAEAASMVREPDLAWILRDLEGLAPGVRGSSRPSDAKLFP